MAEPVENPNPLMRCHECKKLVFKKDLILLKENNLLICTTCWNKSQLPPGERQVTPCNTLDSNSFRCTTVKFCVPCMEILDIRIQLGSIDQERQDIRIKLEKMAIVEVKNMNELNRMNKLLHDYEVKYDIHNNEAADMDMEEELEFMGDEDIGDFDIDDFEDEIEMNQDQGDNYHDK